MNRKIRFGLLTVALLLSSKSLLFSDSRSQPQPEKPDAPAAEEDRPSRARKPRHRIAYAANESQATSAPAAAAAPASKPAEPARFPVLSDNQFRELTQITLDELPTIAKLEELDDEQAHSTPEPVVDAGERLGKIAQAVDERPELQAAAADFYARCAEDQELLTSVRALCYSHVLDSPQAPAVGSLPADVVRLARLIPTG